MIRHTVPELGISISLKQYLRRAWPLVKWESVLKKRDVKLNGTRATGEEPVRTGDEICAYIIPETGIRVIFREQGLLAIEKPQGLPVDLDRDGIGEDTCLNRVRLFSSEARLCHRLDVVTGGVLLFAEREDACREALEAFRTHRVSKRYAAIVRGRLPASRGVYRDHLTKDADHARVRITSVPVRGSLPIETRWFEPEPVDEDTSLLRLEPVTGRTHQLRAHMAFHGFPILMDDQYGDRTLNRHYTGKVRLWCESLSFRDILIRSEYPAAWVEGRQVHDPVDGI